MVPSLPADCTPDLESFPRLELIEVASTTWCGIFGVVFSAHDFVCVQAKVQVNEDLLGRNLPLRDGGCYASPWNE